MNTEETVRQLRSFRDRLTGEVMDAYYRRGEEYGAERFGAWKRAIATFLDDSLPGESSRLKQRLVKTAFVGVRGEGATARFERDYGKPAQGYIDSLIEDIKRGEYQPPVQEKEMIGSTTKKVSRRVFVVHGHDGELEQRTARFLERLSFEAVILHEQPSRGKTVIEKIVANSDVGFAIVLYSPDDLGNTLELGKSGELNRRARQNVVFEHGFLVARLGRDRVATIVRERDIELPSDISGVVWIGDDSWEVAVAKELNAAGFDVDFNRLLR